MPFKKNFYILISLFLLLLSCKKVELEKWERKLYAYCILNPKEKFVTCIVDSNYSIEKEVKSKGIADAKVFIINEERKDTLNLYYYDSLYQGINNNFLKPLNTYSLYVIFQKDTLTKKTKIPDTFSFIFPKDKDTISYDNLNYFYWKRSKGAFAYALFIFKLPKDSLSDYFPLLTKDTFLDMRNIKEGLFETASFYELKVYAWDYNRYQWVVKRGELDTLYKGLGHFSSQTNDSIVIFLKK